MQTNLNSDQDPQRDTQTASLITACSALRILSTLPYTKIPLWNHCVQSLAPTSSRFKTILALLVQAPRQDLILLTGGERKDLLYLALVALLPWVSTPHVVVDAHWQKASGLGYTLQRALFRIARRLTAQVQPHSFEEEAIYHEIFGIPRQVLRAVPWSTSLTGHDVSPARADEAGNFVLTGGLSFRDYAPLFQVLAHSNLTLRVGVPASSEVHVLMKRWSAVDNIKFHTDWSNAQFIRQMAGCSFFVIPIIEGLTRSTADQTILNAMFFGKIVVATDSIGPRIYIRDGINGFLVPRNSPQAWQEAFARVAALSASERLSMENSARYTARVEFNEEKRMACTLSTALEAVSR